MSQYSDTVVADGPVSYWRLGESSGSTAYPTVGASNGTFSGPTLGEAGLLLTDVATSVYFDGASDYISTPGNCGVSGPPLTVEVWIKPDQDAVIGLFDSAPSQTNVIRNYDGDRFEWWSISPYITYNFLKGTRYHVVLTCIINGSGFREMKLYINGSLYSTQTGVNGGTTVTSWRFGDINNGGAGRYKGWMQEVALYNKALSLSQVQSHYGVGSVNLVVRQTVPIDVLMTLQPVQKVPLWADGEKQFYSYPAAPPFEFWGRVYAIDDIPMENWEQNWLNRINPVPVSVDLGWLAPVDKLPFGSAGWLYQGKKLPIEMRGTNGVVHEWFVLQPATGVLSHVWQVAETVQGSDLLHVWTIRIEEGGELSHLWRVLKEGLVQARSRDIQLPYGKQVITAGEGE